MSQEQIVKFEAWATKLEENIVSMGKQRKMFFYIFYGAVAVSMVGFVFGGWLGVATFATGLMVCVAGVYISTTRTWEYQRELERTRFEVTRMRAILDYEKEQAAKAARGESANTEAPGTSSPVP